MSRTVYYAASTLDGFLADEQDSLSWLFKQDQDEQGPLNYGEFIVQVGVLAMGATTYEWLHAHLAATGETWSYVVPTFVFTHRELTPVEGADVRFVSGAVSAVYAEIAAAGGERAVWVVGGGDLAAQFAEAGHLDEMIVYLAPATVGTGRPLFPRRWDFRLVELAQNRAFACARYEVLGPLAR